MKLLFLCMLISGGIAGDAARNALAEAVVAPLDYEDHISEGGSDRDLEAFHDLEVADKVEHNLPVVDATLDAIEEAGTVFRNDGRVEIFDLEENADMPVANVQEVVYREDNYNKILLKAFGLIVFLALVIGLPIRFLA